VIDTTIAYIDLTTGEIRKKTIPERIRKLYFGFRGLDMYLLYNHIEPGVDPIGPKNVLMVSTGPLTGTPVRSPARTHVAALGPLTNGVGSTNMGGFFGPELRFAGFDHLVIKGQAKKPVYLWIHDGEIEIRDADYIWGKDTFECVPLIREHHGGDEDIKVMSIGQAGENLVRFANVRTGFKCAGGRTGMGCVMGSKKLKAIAVKGTQGIQLHDPQRALELLEKAWDEAWVHRNTQVDHVIGRGSTFCNTNTVGIIRNRNFEYNQMLDATDIEPEEMDRLAIGREACFACQIACRFRFKLTTGPAKGDYSVGTDYTTLGTLGNEIDCKSLDVVVASEALCNQWGMDNMEVANLLSWAMELYEKGIITVKDTGIPLEWGDPETIYEMIKQMAFREGFGGILADGCLRAMERLGKEAAYYCLHIKGLSQMHSDERPTPSLALNVATATRGSDHLRGRPIPDLFGLPENVLERMYSGGPNKYTKMSSLYTSYLGKARMVYASEIHSAMGNLMGNCGGLRGPDLPEIIYAITGMQFTQEELWDIGERVYTIERMFNNRQGWTRADDTLPERYFVEPTLLGMPMARGKTIDQEKFQQMLDEYYELHGWDSNGVPTPETLKRMGLDKEPSNMV